MGSDLLDANAGVTEMTEVKTTSIEISIVEHEGDGWRIQIKDKDGKFILAKYPVFISCLHKALEAYDDKYRMVVMRKEGP